MSDNLKYHDDIEQGSDEWHALRNGIITASEMKLILTPTLKTANNDKTKTHIYEIASQRISNTTEMIHESWDMLRGSVEEEYAREYYNEFHNKTKSCGFITGVINGVKVGFSPDGLIDDDGLIEIKSRRQKFQIKTIVLNEVPSEYMLQIQTGLLLTGREWCDFVQYSNGLPLFVKRVYPDLEYQEAIKDSIVKFEEKVQDVVELYKQNIKGLVKTERREVFDGTQITSS